MEKIKPNVEKGFAVKEIIIIVFILAVVTALAIAIFSSMSDSIVVARETKLLGYAAQMKKRVESANSLGAFAKVVTPSWVCLGKYSGQNGDYCWGSENADILNDERVDNALRSVEEVPKGQMSPYKTFYNRGATVKVNPKSIEIRFFIGDTKRAKIVCSQLNMLQDPDDDLSCILETPIAKN